MTKVWGNVRAGLEWAKEHWYIFVIALLLILLIAGAIYFSRRLQYAYRHRNSVKRAMREIFSKSAAAAQSSARFIETTGNKHTRDIVWGKIIGIRETSHAYFVYARPSGGNWLLRLLRLFQRRQFVVARHLGEDTHGRAFKVRALGMTPYEGIWFPDDDFQNPEVYNAWQEVLLESGFELERVARDLPSCVLAWYARIVKVETYTRASIRSIDDTTFNWHVSSSGQLTTRKVTNYDSPTLSQDRADRHESPEEATKDA